MLIFAGTIFSEIGQIANLVPANKSVLKVYYFHGDLPLWKIQFLTLRVKLAHPPNLFIEDFVFTILTKING